MSAEQAAGHPVDAPQTAEDRRARNYAAAKKWLINGGHKPSDLGVRACVLLALFQQGFHHIPNAKAVKWGDSQVIELEFPYLLTTFDSSDLTRLIFLAHDECLRVGVKAAPVQLPPDIDEMSMSQFRAWLEERAEDDHRSGVVIQIWKRKRGGDPWDRHPTLEQAVAQHRVKFPEEGVQS